MRWTLPLGAELELLEDFIPTAERGTLFSQLQLAVPWQKGTIRIAGKDYPEPRLSAWIGDPDAVYTYSGRTNDPTPWPPVLADLRSRIASQVDAAFNSVLCNLYEDGSHSMGMHSDAEPELGRDPVIASLSLGATRRFQLRRRKPRAGAAEASDSHAKLDLDLTDGSLLIMRGTLQTHYRHGVPKQLRVTAARINLTFRHVLPRAL